MSNETILNIGGVYNLALIIFHLFFWKLFSWKKDLKRIAAINQATMQVMNITLIFIFAIFAYISFFHTNELLTTSLGKSLLVLVGLLWLFRAVLQIIFYGLKNKISFLFFIYFVLGGVIYLYPIIRVL